MLLIFKKERFDEEIQLNGKDKEYQEEYNKLFDKDEEIVNIISSSVLKF
jgi:hypothetical protein